MDTYLGKLLLLVAVFFSGFSMADYHACWQEPDSSLSQMAEANVTFWADADNSADASFLRQKLKTYPTAYAVEVNGHYRSSDRVVSKREKERLVQDALQQRGYPGYTCLLWLEGDNDRAGVTSPSTPPDRSDQQGYADIFNETALAIEQSKTTLSADEHHPFTLTLVPYSAVKPHFDQLRNRIEFDEPDATSGVVGTVARYLPLFGAMHAMGVLLAVQGNYYLLTTLMIFDAGCIAYLSYTGPFATMLAIVTAATTKAAIYTATLSSFVLYFESVMGKDEITIDKQTFTKNKLTWDGFKARSEEIKHEEEVQELVEEFIKTLSQLQVGSTISAATLPDHGAFAKFKPGAKVNVINYVLATGGAILTYLKPAAPALVITAQATFNHFMGSVFGKPLSQVVYPGLCTTAPAFINFPLEHTCYQVKRAALDGAGYIVAAGIFAYQLMVLINNLKRTE